MRDRENRIVGGALTSRRNAGADGGNAGAVEENDPADARESKTVRVRRELRSKSFVDVDEKKEERK